MTSTEINILKRIPRKSRKHIVNLTITESNDYNERGRRLNNYTVTWDNGDEHTFQNIEWMLYMIKEYTWDDGYFSGP